MPKIEYRSVPEGEEYRLATEEYYQRLLETERNLLTVQDIVRITGYGSSSVIRWVNKGKLKILTVRRNRFILPKTYVLNFLCGDYYNKIAKKNTGHLKAVREICDTVSLGKGMINVNNTDESL